MSLHSLHHILARVQDNASLSCWLTARFCVGGEVMSAPDLQPFIPLPSLPNWAWQQRTWIMGILNATPDSFSDGGQVKGVQGAVEHACMMVKQGADIVDVGGQSTRPGATPLTTAEEVQRVVPVIRSDLLSWCRAAPCSTCCRHFIISSLYHLISGSSNHWINR